MYSLSDSKSEKITSCVDVLGYFPWSMMKKKDPEIKIQVAA